MYLRHMLRQRAAESRKPRWRVAAGQLLVAAITGPLALLFAYVAAMERGLTFGPWTAETYAVVIAFSVAAVACVLLCLRALWRLVRLPSRKAAP